MSEHVPIALIGAAGMILSALVPWIADAWKTREKTDDDLPEWCPPREQWGPM